MSAPQESFLQIATSVADSVSVSASICTGRETNRSDWLLCICTGHRFDGILRLVACGHRQLAARGVKILCHVSKAVTSVFVDQATIGPQPVTEVEPESVGALVSYRI